MWIIKILGVLVAWIVVVGGIGWFIENRGIKKKYIKRGIIRKDQGRQLSRILVDEAKKALQNGEPARAEEYLKDSCTLANNETPQSKLLFGEIYIARNQGNDLKNAESLAKAIAASSNAEDKEMAHDLLRWIAEEREVQDAKRAEQEALRAAQQRAEKERQFNSVLASYEDTIREADRQGADGKYMQAIERCLEAYNMISGFVHPEQRYKYQKQLSNLAFRIACWCNQLGRPREAITYLQKEDCTALPEYDYAAALIYSNTKRPGAKRHVPVSDKKWTEFLDKLDDDVYAPSVIDTRGKAFQHAIKADEKGIPGAAELRKTLYDWLMNYYDDRIRAEKQYQADLDFEEKYGMMPHEYQEARQKRVQEAKAREAEEAAQRADRRRKLEKQLDFQEYLEDKTSGGSGHTMEEKRDLGRVSAESYAEHRQKREQYLDDNT